MLQRLYRLTLLTCFFLFAGALHSAERFTIATYNLENYVDPENQNRPSKTGASKAKIYETIRLLNADILALQEIGTTNILIELVQSLQKQGVHYPHWEHVGGFDTNIYVAVLSRFPIVARRPHEQSGFLLYGRRFHTSRGFAEVDIQVNRNYQFTLLAAHLKSRRPVGFADQADFRQEEALLLREVIDKRLKKNPNLNLVVLGDFNDVHSSNPIKTILGRGKLSLVDTRPSERNGDQGFSPHRSLPPRTVAWTHHYSKEDVYSRIDYIFLSQGMAQEWDPKQSFILAVPDWGIASDHRPLRAGFILKENSK